ncbi:MAG: threonine ammonia-lyase [Cenarchaeum symbiont of Oopsacas minuta]|nr:threonine ammonia-lyase [Cenarchaeum symbiont of Oopsacas minuta]
MDLTFEDIVKAQKILLNSADIRKTPLVFSPTFSKLTGSDVYLKQEFQQKTGSFKIRGAYYKIRSLSDDEKRKGVVAASAGNHAQGVAFAASIEDISCTIIMPKSASPAKVLATKGYGATVILDGDNYDEASNIAKKMAIDTGATIIHAFDDPQIMAAQGVVGLEILHDLPDVQEIYVPIGGGGLAAGILVAVKEKNPNVRIIGVQSESYHAMKTSVESSMLQVQSGKRTIADGVAVSRPGEKTFSIIMQLIDEIVTVSDEQIVKTMFILMERAKSVVEPAGAISLAYPLAVKPSPGKKIACVLAGGNVDMYLLGQIVDKGLVHMGRLLRITVLLPDRPGAFKDVVDAITASDANIVEVVHDRFSSKINAGSAGVTLSLEMQGRHDAKKLLERLQVKGIQFELLT